MTYRTETDSMGEINVPSDKLWGAQTQRSLQNFRISTETMPPALISAYAVVKQAAAEVNESLSVLVAPTLEPMFSPMEGEYCEGDMVTVTNVAPCPKKGTASAVAKWKSEHFSARQ